jgi:GTP-binding protein SAR1
LVGLDNAGKTTLITKLKDDRMVQHASTLHPNSYELVYSNIKFKIFDMGGVDVQRRVWKEYLPMADAIVFILDASERNRFAEAYAELNAILLAEETATCPIMILGNKIDKYHVAGEEEIISYFNLKSFLTNREKRQVSLFMCSILKGEGYGEGFRWLASQLTNY